MLRRVLTGLQRGAGQMSTGPRWNQTKRASRFNGRRNRASWLFRNAKEEGGGGLAVEQYDTFVEDRQSFPRLSAQSYWMSAQVCSGFRVQGYSLYVCMFVYVFMYACVCMHAWYICRSVCMSVCLYVCM